MSNEKFWMVYSPQGNGTDTQHDSRAEAQAEAERLAKGEPFSDFYVLKAMTCTTAENPKVTVNKLTEHSVKLPF